MERAALERLQQMIDDEVKERFPEGAVRRVMLLQYGDDPVVEPGEVRVRVLIPKDYGDGWDREHMTRMMAFRRELAERLPEVSELEVIPDDPGVPYDHKPRMYVGGGGWLRAGGGGDHRGHGQAGPAWTLAVVITGAGTANLRIVRWALPASANAGVREAHRVGARAR